MILGVIILVGIATFVCPVNTSLIVIIGDTVVHFALQVNTAGTCPPLLLTLRLLLQLIY